MTHDIPTAGRELVFVLKSHKGVLLFPRQHKAFMWNFPYRGVMYQLTSH